MAKHRNEIITVQGTLINIVKHNKEDYVSLTDIAKYRDEKDPARFISLWMRTYATIEYLGLWETLNNPEFNPHI